MKHNIQLLVVSMIMFVACAGNAGYKPFYKPVNIKNDDALQLWNGSNQYSTGGAVLFDNSVKVYVGNNGINNIDKTVGVGLYVEVENNSDEDVLFLIKDFFIKDKNGNIWQVVDLISNDNIKETPTQTLGVNIKTYSVNSESGYVKVNNNNFNRSIENVKISNKTTKSFIVTLASNLGSREILPTNVTVNIKCQKGKEIMNNSVPFNSIEW